MTQKTPPTEPPPPVDPPEGIEYNPDKPPFDLTVYEALTLFGYTLKYPEIFTLLLEFHEDGRALLWHTHSNGWAYESVRISRQGPLERDVDVEIAVLESWINGGLTS